MSTLRRHLSGYWTRFVAAFHYADPGPTRFWLITCAAMWGTWILVTPGELSNTEAWKLLGVIGGERIVGPLAIGVAVMALVFDVVRSKRATVFADILLTAWWLFVAVTLFWSRPDSPSISIYLSMIGFAVWIIYRDADQI